MGTIGLIFPDEGAFDYELLRLGSWLEERGFAQVNAAVERVPGGKASSVAALDELSAARHLLPAAERLSERKADLVLWACAGGSFYRGLSYAQRQAEQLSLAAGVPASSAALDMLAAALAFDEGVDVLTAYPDEVADLFVTFLREGGVRVERIRTITCTDVARPFDLDFGEELRKLAREKPQSKRPILVPSTALDTLDRLPELEDAAQRPVISANQAMLWNALRKLGVRHRASDLGTLFIRFPNE